ncbi:MAG: hypothetical protein K8S25_14275 [Alphaproteobacteria bacterium]|nr:hypothetical protein [Alphaproteobacteria bacterium]
MKALYSFGALLLVAVPAWAAGADRDEDGRVTRAELIELHSGLFAQLDTNGDGVIDMNDGDAHFLDIADFDRDGRVTPEENNTYAAEAAAGDLANCDANGDEVLSGDEVTCITSSDSSE